MNAYLKQFKNYLIMALIIIFSFNLTACQPKLSFNAVDMTGNTQFKLDLDNIAQTQQNNTFKLTQQQNKVTVILFGYTACPDYCPNSLNKLASIQGELKKIKPEYTIDVLFVSIDPKRDTKPYLTQYLQSFNKEIPLQVNGLMPTELQISQLKQNFKLTVDKQDNNLIDHTTGFYVIDKALNLRLYVSNQLTVEQITKDLAQLF